METPETPPTPADTHSKSLSSPDLAIPETRDGFFGYTDEKSLQQASAEHIGEKYWAHRRGSDAPSEATASSFKGLSTVSAKLGEQSTNANPFFEGEDERSATGDLGTTTAPELLRLFHSLQRCLELRDKYLRKSKQRLGDNPKDNDGHFPGLGEDIADVNGVRPDADFSKNSPPTLSEKHWKIYPKPPPPHWHWTDKQPIVGQDGAYTPGEFEFEQCEIPGQDSYEFGIDDTGVYQVYEDTKSRKANKPVYEVPTIKEYFQDLDYVLNIISDGPTKSFAFRRLKYLSSKFTMFSLMNEFQELAEMKVCVSPWTSASLSDCHSSLKECSSSVMSSRKRHIYFPNQGSPSQ
ncbi:hypothetical protein E1B28_012096 [Marasmius oreades]|uniref:Uncharacterized protein n=1 Tax=Marasmius oreades TaxID=181124 RepID=A0A9P7RQV5_9AGAR|nr:uncharacterized protein E1B28_012096 [Marasmius oreades]KAG7088064.1 hypothetical protein E1B28_012096 [Marasmius oreades]